MPTDPYFDTAMQMDPTGLDEERQRAVAAQLRGMGQVGAMGSTSQIKEVASASSALIDQSFSMGKQMGLDKAKKRQEASYERRALKRATSGRAGRPYSGTAAERKDLAEQQSKISTLDGMLKSFDDEFANEDSIGSVKRMEQWGDTAYPNITDFIRDTIGDSIGMTPDDLRDAKASWWRNYKRLAEIPERAAVFGATLTNNEQRDWAAADINPGMKPEDIRRALDVRKRVSKQVMDRALDNARAAGWGEDVVNSYMAGTTDVVPAGIEEAMRTGESSESASPEERVDELAVTGQIPPDVNADEWRELSPEEQADYIKYVQGGG